MTNDFYIQRKVTVLENYNGFAKGDVDQKLLFGFYTNGLVESLETYFSMYSKYIEETIAILGKD